MSREKGTENIVKNRVVVNGANGYVASNFILELLENGYHVTALVRKKGRESAVERMKSVLVEMNEGEDLAFSRLEVFNYSLFEENFKLPDELLKHIFGGNIHYFHFAASLKFDISSKEEIFGTNLQGVTTSVETFLKYTGPKSRFYFVSTAYSCGKLEGVFEERFYEDAGIDAFRNYYEQSKRYAENLIRTYIDDKGLNACILRISQIIGNRKTGVSKTDYGIFDFAKRIQRLAQQNPGMTLRMQIDPDSTQNLLPIDTMVDYFMQIVAADEVPVILNIVSKKPTRNATILESLEKSLPVKLVADMNLQLSEMSRIERIIAVGMSFTGAYININPNFNTENLDRLVKEKPQEVTSEEIDKMIAYFLNRRDELKMKSTG